MVVTEKKPDITPVYRQELLAALERGEIVRVLADVESGRLTPEQFVTLMDSHERKHWLRNFLATVIGK